MYNACVPFVTSIPLSCVWYEEDKLYDLKGENADSYIY